MDWWTESTQLAHGSKRLIKLWPSKLGSMAQILWCERVRGDLFSAARNAIYDGD
jgi:hypothetical protein